MTFFNPECKFHHGQKVKIVSGFHRGKTGKIESVDLLEQRRGGNSNPDNFGKHGDGFCYQVKTGFFCHGLHIYEKQMEQA